MKKDHFKLLQLVFSAYMVVDNVYFSGPLGSHSKITMVLSFKNRVPLMCQVASLVWHLSLPLMNSCNKTESAFPPHKLHFPRTISILRFIIYKGVTRIKLFVRFLTVIILYQQFAFEKIIIIIIITCVQYFFTIFFIRLYIH